MKKERHSFVVFLFTNEILQKRPILYERECHSFICCESFNMFISIFLITIRNTVFDEKDFRLGYFLTVAILNPARQADK